MIISPFDELTAPLIKEGSKKATHFRVRVRKSINFDEKDEASKYLDEIREVIEDFENTNLVHDEAVDVVEYLTIEANDMEHSDVKNARMKLREIVEQRAVKLKQALEETLKNA